MKAPKSVKQILSSKTVGMQGLLQHTQQLKQLNAQLTHLLPLPLSLHCTAAGVSQQTLTLLVESSAWATRLRLQAPSIIRGLQSFNIKTLTVKIQPVQKAAAATSRSRPKMSPDTANLLNDLAETTSDPKLKSALLRLAQNTSQ
ncbi:MAG: DciA family protein [Pseudomonadota bacterium]|nr:DciA family protein [Pseudomonadota bacterium]